MGRSETIPKVTTTSSHRLKKHVMIAIHVFNVAGLLLFGIILTAATVVKSWHFIILVPIVILILSYWVLRTKPYARQYAFVLSLSVFLWIAICENMVNVDNLLGTQITKKLGLGPRLQSYAIQNLKEDLRNNLQQCCMDRFSWERQPGSIYRETYDCPTCNEPYQAKVDETGHTNREFDLIKSNAEIDLFVAGDSVLQGIGMPSVFELVKEQTGLSIWNLSASGYGPRQKINTLITHALPRRPKWLLVDFYSGNDLTDAIEVRLCDRYSDFRCLFSRRDIYRRLRAHPLYRQMLEYPDPSAFESVDLYTENNLTLAVSRFLVTAIKRQLRTLWLSDTSEISCNAISENLCTPPDGLRPASSEFEIRLDMLLGWVKAGMAIAHESYEQLEQQKEKLENKSKVILLYNPSAYEIYRDILFNRVPEYDLASEYQTQTQRSFAEKHGWIFVDLTGPLRNRLREDKFRIYGRYDQTHWSPSGTVVVAGVIGKELLKVLRADDSSVPPPKKKRF